MAGGYFLRSIAKAGGVTWPVLRDSHDDDQSQRSCQFAFPADCLLGSDGKIAPHLSPVYGVALPQPIVEQLLRAAGDLAGTQVAVQKL